MTEQAIAVEPEVQSSLEFNETADDDAEETPVADKSGASQVAVEITEEPINFGVWKVTDLRCPRLRAAFQIPLRGKGDRPLKKSDLIKLYQQAIAA